MINLNVDLRLLWNCDFEQSENAKSCSVGVGLVVGHQLLKSFLILTELGKISAFQSLQKAAEESVHFLSLWAFGVKVESSNQRSSKN